MILEVWSKAGINWNDLQVLTKTGLIGRIWAVISIPYLRQGLIGVI